MAGRVTTFAEIKARSAAEEALRLVRKHGGWITAPGGRIRGYEADAIMVELHTAFSGTAKIDHAHRYQAALEGRGLPDGTATLVVRDEWDTPALVAVLDEQMRVAGVARYREGDWVHEVSAKLTGIPAFVLRDDADDLAAAVATVNLVASRMWPAPSRVIFLGVVMATRALWSHSALLPLVLAEVAPQGLEIDDGPETALTRVCVKRFRVSRPKAFEARLRDLFAGWHVYRGDGTPEVAVELGEGRQWLDAEMCRLGSGDLEDLDIRVALAAPMSADA